MSDFQSQPAKHQVAKPPLPVEVAERLSRLSKDFFTPEEVEVIWQGTPLETQATDFDRYIAHCASLELNPIMNDIHLEYRSSKGIFKPSFTVHIDAYRRRGFATDVVDGIKEETGMDPDLGLWAKMTIYKKGCLHPFEAKAFHREYTSGQGLWTSKPTVMTSKVAEALAYRRMGILAGTVSEDEMYGPSGSTGDDPQFAVGEVGQDAPPAPATTVVAPKNTRNNKNGPSLVPPQAAAQAPTTAPQNPAPATAAQQPLPPPPATAPQSAQVPAAQAQAAPAQAMEAIQWVEEAMPQYAVSDLTGMTPEEVTSGIKESVILLSQNLGIGAKTFSEFAYSFLGCDEANKPNSSSVYAPAIDALTAFLQANRDLNVTRLRFYPREVGQFCSMKSKLLPIPTPEQIAATVADFKPQTASPSPAQTAPQPAAQAAAQATTGKQLARPATVQDFQGKPLEWDPLLSQVAARVCQKMNWDVRQFGAYVKPLGLDGSKGQASEAMALCKLLLADADMERAKTLKLDRKTPFVNIVEQIERSCEMPIAQLETASINTAMDLLISPTETQADLFGG